jgi:hypothetical protein
MSDYIYVRTQVNQISRWIKIEPEFTTQKYLKAGKKEIFK